LCFLQNEKFEVILLATLPFQGITNGALLPSHLHPLLYWKSTWCAVKKCINDTYFAPGRSLVKSSPAAYRDVQQEMISEIRRTSLWPVRCYGGYEYKYKSSIMRSP
jgi:hypothetical protein